MASYHMTSLLPAQSIPNISIRFTCDGVFLAGDFVTGQVVCHFHNNPYCLNIEIRCHGYGKVSTNPDVEGGNESHEEYLDTSMYLFKTGEEPRNVMRGQHDYPFSFRLPDEIPSSIEGKYGYIRYEIEAKVMVKQEQTVFKCVNSHVERFTVLSNVALPLSAQEPIEKEESDHFGCLCCRWVFICCFCKIPVDGLITAKCKLEKGGFLLGKSFMLNAKVTNLGNWESDVIVRLKQHIRYDIPDNPKEEKNRLFKWTKDDITEKECCIDLAVPVPIVPPSPFLYSKLITVEYFLTFTMEAVIDIKIPVMFVTGTSDFEHRIQPDPCVIAPSAPPVELMVSPDENPEESSQDDPPSYEAAVALDSEKRVPQKLPEQLPFMDPYHRPAITTQPSSPDFAQRYSSASSSNPWTRDPTSYSIRTSVPYSYTPLADKK